MKQIILLVTMILGLTYYCHAQVSANNTNLRATETEVLVVAFVTDLDKVSEKGLTVVFKNAENKVVKKGITDIDGRVVVLLPKGRKYTVTVTKTAYDFDFTLQTPTTKGPIEMVQNYVINLFLDFKRSYVLDSIYFETGKAEIKAESLKFLDSLVKVFEANSRFRVEIAGHTDNVGDPTKNMRLSQMRADAVMEYLSGKGVAFYRMLSKGYGDKFPLASNDTPEGRQRNRRIEVKVIME